MITGERDSWCETRREDVNALKIYISADIEGVAGVAGSAQLDPGGSDYFRMRRLMTAEVNAAIEGAFEAGADYVLVNDSHGPMTNILAEELNPRAELICGTPKPLQMMSGLDGTFDAAVLIGYHARMGTPRAVADHSYWGRVVSEIRLNGRPFGEAGLNARVAAHFGVPVVAVSGDEALAAQVHEEIGAAEAIVVKSGLGRSSARSVHPELACRRIREGVARGIQRRGNVQPIALEPPFHFEIRFIHSGMADAAEWIPGVERIGGPALGFVQDDFLKAYGLMRALIALGGTA